MRCRWPRSVEVPVTTVRVRGLGAGGCGVVVGHSDAAAARRGRRGHLLLAVVLWRNSATLNMHQCCLPAGIGACRHDEPADRAAQDAARLAGRVDSQAQRQWWPTWAASNGPAAASFEASAAFGSGIRVRHVENLLLEVFNLVCGASAAVSERSSQRRRRTSDAAAGVPLAEWRARATTMAAAAAGAAGGAAGCTAVVAAYSSCPAVVSPIPHMHAQHAHARVHVHAQVHVHMHAFTIENNSEPAWAI